MQKKIIWIHEGQTYEGTAIFKNNVITLENEKHDTFDSLKESEIENGMTLEEIWEEIPEDVTHYGLK